MLPYAATIFLSAFLLFLVQPLIAKQILPWFGGSAAVWTTCLLFFQSVLLAGYAYADLIVRWLTPRRQVVVHAVLLVASLAVLPIVADAAWKPAGDSEPITRILGLLAATIGLPYLLLSSTTPLLQAWYWRRFQSAVPYRLFALSNFASLLALLGYPVLFEPYLGGVAAATMWSWLYGAFVVVCAATGWISARAAAAEGDRPVTAATDANEPAEKPGAGRLVLWLTLSAMGSCLLLAVSNHITQNVASVPFLWVLPLSLYLVTFIICFDHPRWYQRAVFLPLLAVLLPTMAWNFESLDLRVALPLFAGGLFVACMFCHGELARLKPHPRYLTLFYLAISVGGAIGALLMAIGAPLLLKGYFEMHIMLVVIALLAAIVLGRSKPLLVGAVAVTVVTAWCGWTKGTEYAENVRFMDRDFYGVTRTRDQKSIFPFRAMFHGNIMHGGQLIADGRELEASSYFGPTSGYGRLFASLPDQPRNVGVIGLGAGSLGSYVRPNDLWVFYEIDPIVVQAAEKEFTFLAESRKKAKVEVVLGDGRLSLEREAPRQYDVLAIDAFSGDSIPMHLITREAMRAYVKHLKPDGAIIFQATNRFVDILPLVRRLADEFGMEAVHVADSPNFDSGPKYWLSGTDQVIVSKNRAILDAEPIKSVGQPVKPRPELPTFTDDYYNLLRVIKWD